MRKLVVAGVAIASSFLVGAGLFGLRLHRTLQRSRAEVASEGKLLFRFGPVDPREALASGFEPLATGANYTLGAVLAPGVFLAGAGGVAVYPATLSTPVVLTAGRELPAAPITAMSPGRLRGEQRFQMLLATRGEGLLLMGAEPGQPMLQMRPEDEAARDMTAVLPLPSGDVLLGTRKRGLLLFDGNTLRTFSPAFAGLDVTALAGSEGDFWVGTRTHGLLHWHAGQLDRFDTNSGLPDADVESLLVDERSAFAGTPLGVVELVAGRPSRILAKGTFARSLAFAPRENALLVATVDEGTLTVPLQVDGKAHASFAQRQNQELGAAEFFKVVSHGYVGGITQFAVSRGALLQFEPSGTWKTVIPADRQPLADRNVSALHVAADGRLWVGYFDHGLDVLDPGTARAQHVEDDHVFCVNRIVPDPLRGTVDVATANGLVLFNANGPLKPQQVLTKRDGLLAYQVSDVAFMREGLTVATPAGLTFFTPRGAESLYAFQGLVNNHVYTLAAAPTSTRLVAGTLGGISLLDDGKVRRNLTVRNSGLKRNWITALLATELPDGKPGWFAGTYGGGVVAMDGDGNIAPMEGATGAAVVNPNAMLGTDAHIFVGTLTNGLLMYSRASHRWRTISAGLPSVNVTALAEGGGWLYVGTENGLVRVREARLDP